MSYRCTILAAVLGAMTPAAPSVAQSPVSFSVVPTANNTSTLNGWTPQNIYAVDVNNDGIPDIIQDEGQASANGAYSPTGTFAVSIANGDGTFKPAISVNYPAGELILPMAFGDFNGDGKIDIAMPLIGKNTLAIYLGNGNGTFISPWYFNLPIPAPQTLSASQLVVADFNHDGKLDIALAASDRATTTTVYVLPGAGNGTFSAVHAILTVPTANNSNNTAVQSMAIGDFDSDTNVDIALTTTTGSNTGGFAGSTMHVLYGAGNFTFQDTTPLVNTAPVRIAAGDLNSDGYTDLYGLDNNSYRLDTLYGQPGRLFALYTLAVPPTSYTSGGSYTPTLAMADFNNDGHNDLVTTVADGQSAQVYMVFFLGTSSLGQFSTQTWNITRYTSVTYPTSPVVGDFNRDTRPDFALVNTLSPGNSTIDTGLNQTVGGLWSNCAYPAAGRGIALCSPAGVTTGGTTFSFSAHSFGQLRKMELWLDGKKLTEQYHAWGGNAYLNFSTTLAPGNHNVSVFAVDVDNTIQVQNDSITSQSQPVCTLPASPGVNLCFPTNGSTAPYNPVTVDAAAKITGTLARMEIWVDSTKRYTQTTSTNINNFVYMTPGAHRITVFAVNTSGTVWSSAVNVTVP